jgi:hypothetical protein
MYVLQKRAAKTFQKSEREIKDLSRITFCTIYAGFLFIAVFSLSTFSVLALHICRSSHLPNFTDFYSFYECIRSCFWPVSNIQILKIFLLLYADIHLRHHNVRVTVICAAPWTHLPAPLSKLLSN